MHILYTVLNTFSWDADEEFVYSQELLEFAITSFILKPLIPKSD